MEQNGVYHGYLRPTEHGSKISKKLHERFRDRRRSWAAQECVGSPTLLWFLVLASLCSAVSVSGLNTDGFALLAFKQAIVSDPRNALGNWNASDDTPCAWNGITCDLNQVVSLSLSRKGLLGTLPAELGDLTQLRRLNLHTNALFGPLPPQLFNATFLRSIYLFNNNLSGILSPSVGQLVNLQHLDIGTNGLLGGIPLEISNCQNLLVLIFKENHLTGPIPGGLGNSLKSLQTLDFSSNNLDGSIPPDLGSLLSLQGALELSTNKLTGSIPASLANLPIGVSLDLRNNELSGPVPPIFEDQGRTLSLDNNTGLCGARLPNPCPISPPPAAGPPGPLPAPTGTSSTKGLSKGTIIEIAVGASAGLAFLVLLILYCLLNHTNCLKLKTITMKGERGSANNSSDENSFSNSIIQTTMCCMKVSSKQAGGSECSEKIEPGELIRLDPDVKFDLEELLRASAYVLGKGGVGIVYKAMLEGGLTVAVRRLGQGGAHEYKEFEGEVQMIGKIRHPNIVSLRAYYWAVDEKLLVYDFIPNGTLSMALHARAPDSYVTEPLIWAERLKIAQGCARGLAYIHACGNFGKKKFVHGDIKTSNVLLDENLDARISDLGLARLQSLAGGGFSTPTRPQGGGLDGIGGRLAPGVPAANSDLHVCPSVCYYPPEAAAVDKKLPKPTQKWDVYSFGVVLLELLTGVSPAVQLATADQDLVTWVRQTMEERKPLTAALDVHLSEEGRGVGSECVEVFQIAMSCTQSAPDQRPPMNEVSHLLDEIGRKLEISFSE